MSGAIVMEEAPVESTVASELLSLHEQLASGIPTGSTFDYEGVTYHLEPKALSSRVIRALARLYENDMRPKLPRIAAELAAAKSEQERTLIKEFYGVVNTRMEKFQKMLDTDEGMATIISMCCDQIKDYKEAMEIVENHPENWRLSVAITNATGIRELGNS